MTRRRSNAARTDPGGLSSEGLGPRDHRPKSKRARPDLLLAIKENGRRGITAPGRFLLTGSAQCPHPSPGSADSLAGRMETLQMPASGRTPEIAGRTPHIF